MTRRTALGTMNGIAAWCGTASARQLLKPSPAIVFRNVRIFDGISEKLRIGNVLIQKGKIARIATAAMSVTADTVIIDGEGCVLMPGLTDDHWHMTMAPNSMANLQQADTGLMYAHTVAEARRTLLRGFTTIRDIAGPSFGIKAAIDSGAIPGPRVYPSGALISQTAGHGDFAAPYATPHMLGGEPSHFERIGVFACQWRSRGHDGRARPTEKGRQPD